MWIRVADQEPPSSHDDILVWNGRYKQIARYLSGTFYTNYDESLRFITHWMPIPSTDDLN